MEPDMQRDKQEAVDVISWVSVCPGGLWRVQQKLTHESTQQSSPSTEDDTSCLPNNCPKLGSLCRVRVQLKALTNDADGSTKGNEKLDVTVTELVPTPIVRRQDAPLQVLLGDWIVLRLGEGQCDITEACLEGMRAGEKCEIQLTPVGNGQDSSVHHTSNEDLPLVATVELQAFTPGKESWEMSPAERWEWIKSHKERGGGRFRSGDVWGAADSYGRALKLLIPLCGLAGELEDGSLLEETQQLPSFDQLKMKKAELHSNLSLCQLKLNQPQRARDSAAQATQLEPCAFKAWYRLGQACQKLNELDEAKEAFKKLLELQPDLPAAVKALKEITSREKERNVELGLRLSKMFS
ncbi:PREDICTED: FK506-binding protein-like [Cyprinodon variegatus]|uniref:FKBP prolyl isomerase like n=1 Tax=Cyprinodon variegatus TaxID=28743 RepID=A0A3Q2GIE1_CYPVA|nr:PREDICTED: FK506-binding protein-like [Cyprinodon variegatus]